MWLAFLPSFRYNPSAIKVKQDTIHQTTILWTINATITGRDLSSYKKAITQALNVPQGHEHNYQTSYYLGSKFHTGTQA